MSFKQHHLLKHSLRGLAVLSALCSSMSAVGYFYTIIGPDGHPIVVQQKQPLKKEQAPTPNSATAASAAQTPAPQPSAQPQTARQHPAQPPRPTQPVQQPAQPPVQIQPVQQQPAAPTRPTPQPAQAVLSAPAPVPPPAVEPIQKSSTLTPLTDSPPDTDAESSQAPTSSTQISRPNRAPISILQPQQNQEMSPVTPPGLATSMSDAGQQVILNASPSKTTLDPHAEKNFSEMDGERYVDAEYLEQREFNLEGRKRFYVMPEVDGSGVQRMQTVEREKGITASILGNWRQQDRLENLPKALAPQYHRMPKQDVVAALEQTCFAGRKIDKAKVLSAKNRDIGFWPVAPIHESFAYEVAQIDASVDEILFTSYASSQKIPTYYWPLVVFLDQQGCVIEGVSGFKNQQSDQSKFQHASLEGVLKKPEGALYLFVTPLSSAIDLDASQLSNQGQFKLSMIR